LPSKQVAELLANGAGEADLELSAVIMADVYRLPADAVLLVQEDGRGLLYESRAELQAILTKTDTKATHLLAGRVPQGRNFDAEVLQLAVEFTKRVDIPLDGSEESLDMVDALVRRRGAKGFLEPTLFPGLLAYVGEVLRRAIDGRWEMVLSDDGETWEPWIVSSPGTRHPVSGILAKELFEWNKSSSIRGTFSGHISATRHR
jgi:hypothetical protein